MDAIYVDEVLPRAAQVERQVQRITSRWRAAPAITVVPSAAELPVAAPDDARGLFMRDGVWVVASQSGDTVARTVIHEAVAHFGLRKSLGGSWAAFMGAVHKGVAVDEHVRDLRNEVRRSYGSGLSRSAAADEMAAAIAERLANPRTGRLETDRPLFKRAAAAWGQARREVLLMDAHATYEQIEGALLGAEARLRHGGRFFGIGRRVRDWHTALMSKPWYDKPPMSLEESARMLRAEEERDFSKAALSLVGGVLILLASIGSLLFFVGGLFFRA